MFKGMILFMLMLCLGGCTPAGAGAPASPAAAPTASPPVATPEPPKEADDLLLLQMKDLIIEAWDSVEGITGYNTEKELVPSHVYPVYELFEHSDPADFAHYISTYYDPELNEYLRFLFGIELVERVYGNTPSLPKERYLLDREGIFTIESQDQDRVVVHAAANYYGLDDSKKFDSGWKGREFMRDFVGSEFTFILERREGDWIITGISQRYNDAWFPIWKDSSLHAVVPAKGHLDFWGSFDEAGRKTQVVLSVEERFSSIRIGVPEQDRTMIYEALYYATEDQTDAFMFSFRDDGFGNAGNGTMVMDEAEQTITVTIELSKRGSAEGIFEGSKVFEYEDSPDTGPDL